MKTEQQKSASRERLLYTQHLKGRVLNRNRKMYMKYRFKVLGFILKLYYPPVEHSVFLGSTFKS